MTKEASMGYLSKTERHRIEQQRNVQEIETALFHPRSTIMREVLKHQQESCKTAPVRMTGAPQRFFSQLI